MRCATSNVAGKEVGEEVGEIKMYEVSRHGRRSSLFFRSKEYLALHVCLSLALSLSPTQASLIGLERI